MESHHAPSVTQPTLLDEIMPHFDFHETHELFVQAPPAVAYSAMREVPAGEIRLLRPLMFVRMLPGRLRGRRLPYDASTPAIDLVLRSGFVLLGERPGREIVVGTVGRFWSLSRNQPVAGLKTAERFLSFDEAGYAKATMNILVEPAGSGSRVVTETRILATSPDAKKQFGRYWFLIRWGSGAIRRSWLGAIKRRAARPVR